MSIEAVLTTESDQHFSYQRVFMKTPGGVMAYGRKVTHGGQVVHESDFEPLVSNEKELLINFDTGVIYGPMNTFHRP